MPARIRAYCARTGQTVPADRGAIARVVFESLALKYRRTLEMLEELVGQRIGVLHIVGGGTQNRLLEPARRRTPSAGRWSPARSRPPRRATPDADAGHRRDRLAVPCFLVPNPQTPRGIIGTPTTTLPSTWARRAGGRSSDASTASGWRWRKSIASPTARCAFPASAATACIGTSRDCSSEIQEGLRKPWRPAAPIWPAWASTPGASTTACSTATTGWSGSVPLPRQPHRRHAG